MSRLDLACTLAAAYANWAAFIMLTLLLYLLLGNASSEDGDIPVCSKCGLYLQMDSNGQLHCNNCDNQL